MDKTIIAMVGKNLNLYVSNYKGKFPPQKIEISHWGSKPPTNPPGPSSPRLMTFLGETRQPIEQLLKNTYYSDQH